MLEKREESTEKEQAKDLVRASTWTAGPDAELTLSTESQDPRAARKGGTAECQLQLQSDCDGHARNLLRHLQRHQGTPGPEQPTGLVDKHQHLATMPRTRCIVPVPAYLHPRLCWILPWRPQEGRKGRGLLHALRRWLVHREHGHVGPRHRRPSKLEEQQQQQGHVGMVVRQEHPVATLLQPGRLRARLQAPGKMRPCGVSHIQGSGLTAE